ncbi:YchJ family metal-binding protein [Nonomuraea soli]
MAGMKNCPCGLPAAYRDCCGRLHDGQVKAGTAEQLMRSRYSAYAKRLAAYLRETWHPSTRPERIDFERGLEWTGLTIERAEGGSPFHTEGTVEFRARFHQRGAEGEMHEISRFTRYDGAWVYVDGKVE